MISALPVPDSRPSVAGIFPGGGRFGWRLSVTTALGLATGLGRRGRGAVLTCRFAAGFAGGSLRARLVLRRGRRNQDDDPPVGGLVQWGVVRHEGSRVGEAAG